MILPTATLYSRKLDVYLVALSVLNVTLPVFYLAIFVPLIKRLMSLESLLMRIHIR